MTRLLCILLSLLFSLSGPAKGATGAFDRSLLAAKGVEQGAMRWGASYQSREVKLCPVLLRNSLFGTRLARNRVGALTKDVYRCVMQLAIFAFMMGRQLVLAIE